MGISSASAEFLIRARATGVRFDRTLVVGRQAMFVSPVTLARLFKRHGLWPAGLTDDEFYQRIFGSPFHADGFLRLLGAQTLDVLDYSPYEGATVIHDLNRPIDPALAARYDVVLEGGTLEHVFNFPEAIRSLMEMVHVGGHLLMITPANNYFGHGFYQFSPELLYRVLSEENGYAVERLLVAVNDQFGGTFRGRPFAGELRGRFYEVVDPAVLRDRVALNNNRPVLMYVQARRTRQAPIFQSPPLQSDYQAAWARSSDAAGNGRASGGFAGGGLAYSPKWARLKDMQLRWLPAFWRAINPLLMRRHWHARSLANRKAFKPLD